MIVDFCMLICLRRVFDCFVVLFVCSFFLQAFDQKK